MAQWIFGGRTIAASGGHYYFYIGAGHNSPRIFMSPANRVRWIAILVTTKSSALCRQSATHILKPHRTLLTWRTRARRLGASFRFIPRELAIKCRRLIESYHAIYGYVGLPDMLWLSDARDIIERDRELTRIFKRAARSRAAKRANDSFLHIATTIVSLEVLARDFSGWGKRFPAAKCEAEEILGRLPQLRRAWLMDLYFFPPLGVRREFGDTLTFYPTETPYMSAAPRLQLPSRAARARL